MNWKAGTHQLSPSMGWVRLNTFKEGLLSRMGHDLTLEVESFDVRCTIDEGDESGPHEVSLSIDKDTFRVVAPSSLSAKDRAEIHKNICKHMPGDPSFRGTLQLDESGGRLQGQVKVAPGKASVPISTAVRFAQGRVEAEIELSHQALQMKPYRAPLGVIRLQDRVVLSFSLDLSSLFEATDA